MAVARRIAGLQDQYERVGAERLRDIRPFTTRLSEALRSQASGLVLAVAAAATYAEPAVLDLAVPLSALYAAWVLTRRVQLPLRLPVTAGRRDYGHPEPGSRKPRPASGTWFIGWDIDGRELWVTPEDVRQHMTIPGTTGAGKTTAILSLLVNALAQGSGFVLVDGKANRTLFSQVMALARRFGREDDLRVLNFMVASGSKHSDRFNPFSIGNPDAIKELLASQLGEQAQNDQNGVFRERAVSLIGTITPALVWLRDNKCVLLNIETIRFSIELRWIWKLAMQKIALLRDPLTGKETQLDVSGEIPEDITWPLRSYLGELPGYDPDLPLDKQKSDEPSKQHGYAQFYFTPMFAQLAVSLGHIFRAESGEIDMRDIVLNRRILVVNLPALENSDATLAALGKLVVASLRGMMAQLLGVSLEGDYSGGDEPGMGPTPFPVVLDELAYYATSGLDRMLAQGRSLNIAFILGFQEVPGIWARLGEKTASLLGNANLTIAMRQQDAGRTRDWIEKTAGQSYVSQVGSYQGALDGAYRESMHAELRPVSRVDWSDLQTLNKGEAIILFGGRRIYGRVFHAEIDDSGPKRLGRGVDLRPPDPASVRATHADAARLAALIANGDLARDSEGPRPPIIDALIRGFAGAATAGGEVENFAAAALQRVSELPEKMLPPRPSPPADGMPVTSMSPMLASASASPMSGPAGEEAAPGPVDLGLMQAVMAIERGAGQSERDAREAALALLGVRGQAGADSARIEPPVMTPEAFQERLAVVVRELDRLSRASAPAPRAVA